MMEIDTAGLNQEHTSDKATQTAPIRDHTFGLQRKIKTLKQKIKRRDLKIQNMTDLLKEMKKQNCCNDSLEHIIKNYFEGLPLEFILHEKKCKEVNAKQRRYSDIMKQFAHTLYFYSPKAYNFVRQYWSLPNGRTIRKWLCKVNCRPGILSEVLNFLKNSLHEKPFLTECALIFDAMAIRKQILWDDIEGKFTGYTDFGGIIDIDYQTPATEALFFQIVSYTGNFKCPIAYFLIDKTNADFQAQIIIACLRSFYEIGINVRSIACDGSATNLSTFKILGCNLDLNNFVTHMQHPCSEYKVYFMLDTCHLLKLARNTFAEKHLKSDNGLISWKYLKYLDELQEDLQLKFANSLSSAHVYYKNKVMNVRLAAQALSSGVADALE